MHQLIKEFLFDGSSTSELANSGMYFCDEIGLAGHFYFKHLQRIRERDEHRRSKFHLFMNCVKHSDVYCVPLSGQSVSGMP